MRGHSRSGRAGDRSGYFRCPLIAIDLWDTAEFRQVPGAVIATQHLQDEPLFGWQDDIAIFRAYIEEPYSMFRGQLPHNAIRILCT